MVIDQVSEFYWASATANHTKTAPKGGKHDLLSEFLMICYTFSKV